MPTNVSFLRTAKKRLSHTFRAFFWHTRPSCTFSFTKSPRCLKLLIPASNAIGRWGGRCWIVAGMPAEQKQLIRASQIAAHKTPSAPESPLSLCYVTDRERRGERDYACAQNVNTCCFFAYGKLTSACVLKALMADWNSPSHFDTPSCIYEIRQIFVLTAFIEKYYSVTRCTADDTTQHNTTCCSLPKYKQKSRLT